MRNTSFLFLLLAGAGAIAACGGGGNNNPDMPGPDMPVPDMPTADLPSSDAPTSTAPPGTCILDYAIAADDAQLDIRDVIIPAGNGAHDIGPGRVVVLVPSNGSAPADGAAGILFYRMTQTFSQDITVVAIDTMTAASAGNPMSVTPINAGTLSGQTITWGSCPKMYGNVNASSADHWTPEDATDLGDGCAGPYYSTGNVQCTGLCSAANLEVGANPTNANWFQPFESFTLGTDFATITMDYMEIPNTFASTTWVRFTGTLTSMDCN